jgi:hypothetical protein
MPDGGGECLELFVEIEGNINNTAFGHEEIGGLELAGAECTREYYKSDIDDDEDGKKDVVSHGLRLVFTGALANTLIENATNITVYASEADVVAGGGFIVWPQTGAPDPQSDAAYVDFSVTGALSNFSRSGLGGFFNIDSVSGPDDEGGENDGDTEDDGDDIIDDGEGAVGGSFYIGFGDTDYVTGAFTVNCGNNTVSAPPPPPTP